MAFLAPISRPQLIFLAELRCGLPNNTVIQPFPGAKPDLIPKDIFFTCKNTTTPLEVISVDASKKWVSLALVNIGTLWDFKGVIFASPCTWSLIGN